VSISQLVFLLSFLYRSWSDLNFTLVYSPAQLIWGQASSLLPVWDPRSLERRSVVGFRFYAKSSPLQASIFLAWSRQVFVFLSTPVSGARGSELRSPLAFWAASRFPLGVSATARPVSCVKSSICRQARSVPPTVKSSGPFCCSHRSVLC
jgi:hypothetical protein